MGHVLYLAGVTYFLGTWALAFHLIYSPLVALMYETINYVEHYGLLRKILPGGIPESVKITHSWNAPQVVANNVLFKLQRHSDHHANAYKPYQVLDSLAESPMLPYGYSVALILAVVPPLWFRVIDPLAIAANKGEKLTPTQQRDQDVCLLSTLLASSVAITTLGYYML